MMGFPFHSLVFCSSRQESGGKKKPKPPQNQISCLDFFKQRFVWVGQDMANVLSCLFLENLQVFTLETLRPLRHDEQVARDAGMLQRFCTLGTRALPWPTACPAMSGSCSGVPPQLRGPWLRAGGGTYWVTAPLSAAPGSLRRSRSQRRAGPGLLGLGDLRRSQLGPGVIWPQAIILHKAL